MAPGPGLFPAFSATGQDVWVDQNEREGSAIIISAVGARCGKCFRADRKWSAIANTHVVWPYEEVVERDFLWFKVNDENFWIRGGSAQPFVKTRESFEKQLLLPPLQEQRRIVERIETLFVELDKGEESLRQVQILLARYRQSVLKAAVTGELTADWRAERTGKLEHGRDLLERILQTRRDNWEGRGRYSEPSVPKSDDLPELPEGWVWTTVEQLLRAGLSNGRSVPDAQEGFPVLRLTALKDGWIDLSERKIGAWDEESARGFLIQSGDILVSRGNGSKRLVGRGGLILDEPDPVAYPDTMIKVPLLLDHLSAEWFVQLWNSPFMREQIEKAAKTTAGIYKINQTDIRGFKVPLPPLEEQLLIAEKVGESAEAIAALESQCGGELKRSAALRQSILKDAFSGCLVPQDPNDESASNLLARIRQSRDPGQGRSRRKKSAARA